MFVDAGIKIDIAYYRNVLLSRQLLPVIYQISGEFFIFQQDSVPAHSVRDTINLLESHTPAFISPDLWMPNSPDLNPVVYKEHYAAQSLSDKGQGSGRFECLIDVRAGIQPYRRRHQPVA